MYCMNCGARVVDNARFCATCGAQVISSSANAGGASYAPMGAAHASQSPTSRLTSSGYVEGVEPNHEYAGFLKRFAAQLIDGFILSVCSYALGFGVAFVLLDEYSTAEDVDSISGFIFLLVIVGYWLYFAIQESSEYQATIGKRALGIVVTDEYGRRLSFGRATGRYWAKWLSYLTFFIGFLIAAFTAKRQALHDLVASTLVVNR